MYCPELEARRRNCRIDILIGIGLVLALVFFFGGGDGPDPEGHRTLPAAVYN